MISSSNKEDKQEATEQGNGREGEIDVKDRIEQHVLRQEVEMTGAETDTILQVGIILGQIEVTQPVGTTRLQVGMEIDQVDMSVDQVEMIQ